MDVRNISSELMSIQFPEVSDLILTSPPMLAIHPSNFNREHTPPCPDIS
jgi:hypothetical protein